MKNHVISQNYVIYYTENNTFICLYGTVLQLINFLQRLNISDATIPTTMVCHRLWETDFIIRLPFNFNSKLWQNHGVSNAAMCIIKTIKLKWTAKDEENEIMCYFTKTFYKINPFYEKSYAKILLVIFIFRNNYGIFSSKK